ncbi:MULTISPECIES: prolyl oligopeptidase family serine peptidase [unclassified Sphingobium]|uniref:prolyl oligopeptidase family serine peptidase n=1 Tax=unclassified Sphingobium TaxID=2611147 RepID=UPI0022253C3A|nr:MULTISPECIES: prolyl oligopeptidase family serine peptidase [unclassified Sphingobium]MCW2351649.1 prolyl oligopeptidase [Sphingobium sp. B12D2B]MCW2370915.1 prolyl oligopeptidase [Sphingobium sp. B11D3D]
MLAVPFRLPVAALLLAFLALPVQAQPGAAAAEDAAVVITTDAAAGRAVDSAAKPGALRIGPAPRLPALRYPQARRLDLTETHFGVPVADPYRWLEGDPRHDPDVQAWIAAENETTFRYLKSLPGREALRARMATLHGYERFGNPRKAGERYFYTHSKGENFSPIYVREGVDGAERLLIDPNRLSTDGSVALAEWLPSRDGRALLLALQERGSDWRTVRVLDVESGALMPDQVAWVRYSALAWNHEGSGFYYARFAAPTEGGRDPSFENQQVWFHALGTAQAQDRLVYATPDRPRLLHRAEVTADGRWLLISSKMGTEQTAELVLIPLTVPDARPVTLVRGLRNAWQMIGQLGDRLYFRTDAKAPNGRIVTIDAGHPRRRPVEVVAERAQTLAGGSMIGSRLVLAYIVDGRIVAEITDLAGKREGDVPLPGLGAAAGFSGRPGDPETFYAFSSFTQPPTIYRFNVETGETSIFARSALGFDPADYVTEQVFYPARDGIAVPMFIVRRRDLARAGTPAPTLLYGYGGFNVAQTPSFSPTRFAWVEQGGVLAIAGVRGGGEFGKAWYDAGRGANKQTTFDDFIAAAEYLKAQGYTGANQLAVEGRSNGGLLVGAVVNQRPDLFAAALPGVGVMDMLRFDQFTAGAFWVDDYGRPDREADFRALLAYSPYHNIRSEADYPAILVTTADSDDRVVPGHSFKYAAALQAAPLGGRPRLIRVDTGTGHGINRPTDKIVDEYADMYSFAAYWTGLTLRPRSGRSSAPTDDANAGPVAIQPALIGPVR